MTDKQGSSRSGHRASLRDVQALRGIAAAMVMCYHTGTIFAVTTNSLLFGNLLRGGFLGVDFFFVLSGFVMYWAHARDFGQPHAVSTFAKKRLLRIFPVYWLVVIAKLARDWKSADLLVVLCGILLIPYPKVPYITVAWTLSYEMFFYVAVALMIVLPKGIWTLVPPLLLLACALLPSPMSPESGDMASVLIAFPFNSHLTEFLMGLGVGWLYSVRSFTQRQGLALVVVSALVLAAMLAAATWLSLSINNPYVYNAYELAELRGNAMFDLAVWLMGLPFALLLLGFVIWEHHTRKAMLPFLGWLGDISYSLYLIHGFVIVSLMKHDAVRSLVADHQALILLVEAWAVAVAAVVHYLIERPLMNVLKKRMLPGAA